MNFLMLWLVSADQLRGTPEGHCVFNGIKGLEPWAAHCKDANYDICTAFKVYCDWKKDVDPETTSPPQPQPEPEPTPQPDPQPDPQPQPSEGWSKEFCLKGCQYTGMTYNPDTYETSTICPLSDEQLNTGHGLACGSWNFKDIASKTKKFCKRAQDNNVTVDGYPALLTFGHVLNENKCGVCYAVKTVVGEPKYAVVMGVDLGTIYESPEMGKEAYLPMTVASGLQDGDRFPFQWKEIECPQ